MRAFAHKTLLGFLGILSFALIASTSATAAPQILAVAASNTPMPFHCEDGICEVEVSAMCLQEKRRYPDPQTVYTPHDDQSFTLVYTDADGKEHRVVAGDAVEIRSKRSFTAVRVTIPESTVAKLGAEELALHVAGGASLIPEAVAHDFYPQTDIEIAEATGPLRSMAAGWLDAGGDRAEASRLVSDVLNGLPDEHQLPLSIYEAAWLSAEEQRGDTLSPGALEQARAIYDRCHQTAIQGNYRRCLEKGHDATLYRMNIEYWDAVKAGS